MCVERAQEEGSVLLGDVSRMVRIMKLRQCCVFVCSVFRVISQTEKTVAEPVTLRSKYVHITAMRHEEDSEISKI